MTILRRTAQLVEDMRTLNVLYAKDEVRIMQYSDKSIELIIFWDAWKDSKKNIVKKFLEDEFGQINIKVLFDNTTNFVCRILLQ